MMAKEYPASEENRIRKELGKFANRIRHFPLEKNIRIHREAVESLVWQTRTKSGGTGLGGACKILEETEGGRMFVRHLEGLPIEGLPLQDYAANLKKKDVA